VAARVQRQPAGLACAEIIAYDISKEKAPFVLFTTSGRAISE
jgi:hypothetical protein